MTLCCVLPHLIDRELRKLNTARMRENPPQAAVEEPMPAMIVGCGRLLTWYSNVQRTNMTHRMILENREEGVAVLWCLQDTCGGRLTARVCHGSSD